MSFNFRIYNRIAQTDLDQFEDSDVSLENPQIPEIPEIPEKTQEIEQNFENFEQNSPKNEENAQISEFVSNGALDASKKFESLFVNFGLDQLGNILSPDASQMILSNLVDQTLSQVFEKLGI